jgi:hypothetical protein
MVERLLDTVRGARVNGFAASMARNAVRRMVVISVQIQQPGQFGISWCTEYIRKR